MFKLVIRVDKILYELKDLDYQDECRSLCRYCLDFFESLGLDSDEIDALNEAQIKLELEKKLSNVDYKITKVSKEKISGRDFIIADAEDEDGKFLIYITKLDETHVASGQLFDEYFSGFHSDLMYVSTVLSTVSAVSK